ncbi:MAG TPA: Phenylacetic acid catabolic protein [Ktedonobacterales bacterium]|jgi:phenylacetate-CoA oxygenase PaaI subunit
MTTEISEEQALFDLLAALADNKYRLGRRYAEWCNGAPTLESSVAAAAMAQDELGHARALYPLLQDFPQGQAQPVEVEPETRTIFSNVAFLDEPFTGWADFVAANFLLDTALSVVFEFAQESHFEPLRGRAKKVLQEEQVHILHGEGWVRRLARTGGAVRGTLEASLKRAWLETVCWFGPADDARGVLLQQGNILSGGPEDLRQRWFGHVGPALLDTELAGALALEQGSAGRWQVRQPLPWARWDAEKRRLKGASPKGQSR